MKIGYLSAFISLTSLEPVRLFSSDLWPDAMTRLPQPSRHPHERARAPARRNEEPAMSAHT